MNTAVLDLLLDESGSTMTKRGPKAPSPKVAELLIEVGKRIRLARVTAGMSQEDLRKRAKLGFGDSVSRIENGKNNLTLSMLIQIADALDVPIPDLIAPPGTAAATPRPQLPLDARQAVMQATLDALVAASPAKDEIEATIAEVQRRVAHTRAVALRDLAEAERLEQDAERREGKRPPAINGGPAPESPPEK